MGNCPCSICNSWFPRKGHAIGSCGRKRSLEPESHNGPSHILARLGQASRMLAEDNSLLIIMMVLVALLMLMALGYFGFKTYRKKTADRRALIKDDRIAAVSAKVDNIDKMLKGEKYHTI